MSITRHFHNHRTIADPEIPSEMSHFLYFDARASADEVATLLEERTFTVSTQPAGDGTGWLVVVRHLLAGWRGIHTPPSDYFEAIAHHFDGEYGGWEIGPMQLAS